MGLADKIVKARGLSVNEPVATRKRVGASSEYSGSRNYDTTIGASKSDLQEAYTKNTWVYSGINRISMDIAGLKVRIFKINDVTGEKEDVTSDKKFDAITRRSNVYSTAFDLWEATFINLESTGESFWEIVRDKQGFIKEIYPISAHSVEVITHPKLFIVGYNFTMQNGGKKFIEANKVIYIKYYNPLDDFHGLGAISPAISELILNINSLVFGTKFFENSASPNGVIESEEDIDDEEYERLRSQWNEAHQGLDKSSKIAFLPPAMKFKQVGMTQQDMQFIDQLNLSTDSILSSIGTPPAVVGRYGTAIRANADVQEQSYWNHSIRSKTKKLESFGSNILCPMMNTPNGNIRQFFEARFEMQFDWSEVPFMQENAKERVELLIKAADRASVTPNEIRQALRSVWPSMPFERLAVGGDNTLVLQNLQHSGFSLPTNINKIRKQEGEGIEEITPALLATLGITPGAFDITSNQVATFNLISQAARIGIDANLREEIIDIFRQVSESGGDVTALAAALNGKFEELQLSQALRIARTEVLGTANFATLEGFFQAGIELKKTWLTSRDAAVRGNNPKDVANHVRLDGETIDLIEKFSNGLKYPGDQTPGDASEVVNCRCTLVATTEKSRLSKQESESIKDILWKQFDRRTKVFENIVNSELKDFFSETKDSVLMEVSELTRVNITDGAEIAFKHIPIGTINNLLAKTMIELLIVSGNDAIGQARRTA